MDQMSPALRGQGWSEKPVFFSAGKETLLGLVAEPLAAAGKVGVLLLQGGNNGPSAGRNQLAARLCHRLAQEGYLTLRFDYRGVGDSTGLVDRFRLDEPFIEDCSAAIACLRIWGAERFVLVGGCFGARTALASAAGVAELVGLVLIGVPVRDKEKDEFGTWEVVPQRTLWQYALRAVRPRVILQLMNRERREVYWRLARRVLRARSAMGRAYDDDPRVVSPTFMTQLEAVFDRAIPVLFVYNAKDPSFLAFQRAMHGRLGVILDRARSRAQVEVHDGRVLSAAHLVEPIIDLISAWLADRRLDDRPISVPTGRKDS